MTFADDFSKILAEHGTSITIVAVGRSIGDDGFVSESESTTSVNAIVQPIQSLGRDDLRFLADLGYTTDDLQAYVESTTSVNAGDEIEYNSQRYVVNGVAKQSAYMKLLLKLKQ